MYEPKVWQVFKRSKATGIAEIAFPDWQPMTEREATTVASKFQGTYQPCFSFFPARLDKQHP